MNIVTQVEKTVYLASQQPTNIFTSQAWDHIASVVKFATLLAEKQQADIEICQLSALLHDYASISNKDWVEDHHHHGARLAQELLETYEYPQEKIDQIKHAILNHRGSRKNQRETIEAQILADADAMAHFDNLPALLYLAFVVHKLDYENGKKFVRSKLERSWNKLSASAKEVIGSKKKEIFEILEK